MFYDSISADGPLPISTRDILRVSLWMDRVFAQVIAGEVPMTVLVTGATGFVGGALVERLLAQGTRDVRVVARAGARRDRLDAAVSRYPQARVQRVDANLIAPADAARAVEGVDVIYHLAASMRGAPADMFLNTVVASQHLLDGLSPNRKVRIVLVSSFSVYGVAELPRGALVDESTPLEAHPRRRDLYAHVKLRQERLFREHAARHPFELVVLRPGVIYGPGGSPFSSRVGLNMFGLFLTLGGRNILPLTYVDNCADAIVAAGRAPAAAGEIYNVVDDDLPTCDAYLQAYKEAGASDPKRPRPVPRAVAAVSRSRALPCAGRTGSYRPSSRPTSQRPPGVATASSTASSRPSAGHRASPPKRACAGPSPGCASKRPPATSPVRRAARRHEATLASQAPNPPMSRRAKPHLRCDACRMHRSLCICALLPRIPTRTRVLLVLHQLETQKPTNTGVVAARCLTNSAVVYRGRAPAGVEAEPLEAALAPDAAAALLFPHPSATPLEAWAVTDRPALLVVPDGTWPQAARARRRVPPWRGCPACRCPRRARRWAGCARRPARAVWRRSRQWPSRSASSRGRRSPRR